MGDANDALFRKIEQSVAAALERVEEQRERITEAFLAETGLKPSECELVQYADPNGIGLRWHIRRRAAGERLEAWHALCDEHSCDHSPDALQRRIDAIQRQRDAAEQELAQLRRTPEVQHG